MTFSRVSSKKMKAEAGKPVRRATSLKALGSGFRRPSSDETKIERKTDSSDDVHRALAPALFPTDVPGSSYPHPAGRAWHKLLTGRGVSHGARGTGLSATNITSVSPLKVVMWFPRCRSQRGTHPSDRPVRSAQHTFVDRRAPQGPLGADTNLDNLVHS